MEGSSEHILVRLRCTVRSGDTTGWWGSVETSLAGPKGVLLRVWVEL